MNIAFAGFRHNHIINLYKDAEVNSDINIIACYEEDTDARCSMTETLEADFNADTYGEILKNNMVDAIAIGDYYGKRGKMIIDALKNGKHVICDKPLCTTLSELDEIERLSTEKNLVVACMLDLRFLPQAIKAKELIGNGEIGEVKTVSFTGQHPLMFSSRPSWYFEEGKHGGTINDIAIHGIDLVRWLTKKNLTKIDFAKTWNAFADRAPDFKDSAVFTVTMEDVTVSADVSYSAPSFTVPTYWNFQFWGIEGMISFNYWDNRVHIYKKEETVIDCDEMKSPVYFAEFINQTEGKPSLMTTKDILQSQRQVLMIQKASE
ncbi:MAG: Gfo/Idh/MocA family oxidoreductase [Clostridia bacterium]|nr:Gfo/Idh/MocA family oxidoreductase [Clostridia bacterium]